MFHFACKSCSSSEALHNTEGEKPPIATDFSDVIEEGHTFFLLAKFIKDGKQFHIDFCLKNKTKDIALRVSVCVSPKSLIRSSCVNGEWSVEEHNIPSWLQLPSSEYLELQTHFQKDVIYIGINCLHVACFSHRIPYSSIRRVEVNGDINNITFTRMLLPSYPLRRDDLKRIIRMQYTSAPIGQSSTGSSPAVVEENMQIPYYALFSDECLEAGWNLVVTGRIHFTPNFFKVSLQVGRNIFPHPVTAIQLEFYFHETYDEEGNKTGLLAPNLLLKSFDDLKWSDEVKVKMETGLRPGENFHLRVTRGEKAYQIHLNNKYICDYLFRVNPTYIDVCLVEGDIELLDVVIEKD